MKKKKLFSMGKKFIKIYPVRGWNGRPLSLAGGAVRGWNGRLSLLPAQTGDWKDRPLYLVGVLGFWNGRPLSPRRHNAWLERLAPRACALNLHFTQRLFLVYIK